MGADSKAQTPEQPLPTRQGFVFHVYVDPLHGDNARATADNPSTTGAVGNRPLDFHPGPAQQDNSTWWWPIGGYLQHAPYAFRTLSGSTGAIAYANALGVSTTEMDDKWWSHPDSTASPPKPRWICSVVIHCLPGLYGPNDPVTDTRSGLPFNGETWPVVLRSRVALQGTSHLDTIFDLRGRVGRIVEVNDTTTPPADTFSHQRSFIDGIQFRGARSTAQSAPGDGAAIFIHGRNFGNRTTSCRVRITNCVFTDNVVGVGVDQHVTGSNNDLPMRPHIVNNTFAWNACGLWMGPIRVDEAPVSIHSALIVNNVFDSGSPPGVIAGISGFEGVSTAEKQIQQRGALTGLNIDTNAWEVDTVGSTPYVNLGVTILNWPSVAPSTGPPPAVGPRVNIAPYTKSASGRPGALYINDIFRLSGIGASYSPHDFRLAPSVTTSSSPPTTLNPLIDEGVGWDGITSPFPVVIFSGEEITDHGPGILDACAAANLTGWDYDGEGWGNPRNKVYDHLTALGAIDIGADEADELIMAGYIDGTRIYSQGDLPTTSIPDHRSVYFFNQVGATQYPRPVYNAYAGGIVNGLFALPWWSHKTGTPDLDSGNYTLGSLFSMPPIDRRIIQVGTGGGALLEPWHRNLACDFSPHLLADPHPFWPNYFRSTIIPPATISGPYSSNPWFGHLAPVFPGSHPLLNVQRTADNPALYHNIGGQPHGRPDSSGNLTIGTFDMIETAVRAGHINPPGTFDISLYEWVLNPTQQFGPFAPCTGGSNYTVGPWGYGSSLPGCVDLIPDNPNQGGVGIRLNCEIRRPQDHSNLQTFLAVPNIEPQGTGELMKAAGRTQSPSQRRTTIRSAERRWRNRKR